MVSLMAAGAASVAFTLGPGTASPRGSGRHVVDASATPLAATADRIRLQPATPTERATLRAVAVVTTDVSPSANGTGR